MTPRIAVVLVVVSFAAGCASRRAPVAAAPSAAPARADRPLSASAAEAVKAAKAEDAMLVCRMEYPTGSNIPRRICRTRPQMAHDRDEAQRLLRTAQQAPPSNPRPPSPAGR